MPSTSFFTTANTDTKPMIDGSGSDVINRYAFVNSRNQNRKIVRQANTTAIQLLGIAAPTVAPTGTAGTGANLFYCYVYVTHNFKDVLAAETDPYLRSNRSPVLTIASVTTAATNIIGTVSTDTQVTHLWLYVGNFVTGPFYRLLTGYEQPNTGTPTWPTGVTTVPTTNFLLEINNFPPDTCRIVAESNGFFTYAGFIPITQPTASVTIGSPTVTITSGTWPDGIIGLNLQFSTDTTGGPNNTGIHIATYATTTTLTLKNADGTNRNYDGPTNKTNANLKIWRDPAAAQISKRYNLDSTPGITDVNFLVRGNGAISGIAKPPAGFALRFHYNDNGKKSVEIVDYTQGMPVRRFQTSSPYSMSNPKCWTTAGGRSFYYDFSAGIIEDKGMVHQSVTHPSIPNLIKSLSVTSNNIAEMQFDELRNLMFLSCVPPGFNKSYYMIVYNLTTGSWNLWFMLPDVFSMGKIYDANNIPFIYTGSSQGSIMIWPSVNFNEGVGSTSLAGALGSTDDSTHLTAIGTPFPVIGDKLKDRWVMVWDDSQDIPVYQFARISDNTTSRLTLDTFIGPNSTGQFSPVPQAGWAWWCGPIQCILGPNYEYNAIPDEDGQLMDVAMTTSGVDVGQVSRLALYRNLETTPFTGTIMRKNLYSTGDNDPDHQSFKSGVLSSIESTGITGWQVTDNNESALSIKSIIKRVSAVSKALNTKQQREQS